MNEEMFKKTGIYIAYPTSPVLKSIYKAGGYKTKVNDQHTKVGIAKDSFKSRSKSYLGNFDNEVVFIPMVFVDKRHLKRAEDMLLSEIELEFCKVGHAREWFDTLNRKRISDLVFSTLATSGIEYKTIQSIECND